MGKTDLDLEGQSLVSKVDYLTSALNELILKPTSPGDLNFKQDAVKEDSEKDSGHESVSDNDDDKDDSSLCTTSHSTKTSALPRAVSESYNRETENDDGCSSCVSSQSTKTCIVLRTVSDDKEEKDEGGSPCLSSQSTKTSAVLSSESIYVDLKNRSPAANDCDTNPGNTIAGDEEKGTGETKDKAAAPEVAKEQIKAVVVDDAGEESDEDNESVVIPDVGLKTSATGTASRFLLPTPVDDVVYQERGPCKVPRPHLVASRYNPMSAASESRDCDAYSYGGLGSPTPALTASSYYLPLTPPYSHDDVFQDNFLDTSPFTDEEVSALQLSHTPGYNTPVYSTNNAPTPAYNDGYSSSNNLSGPSYALSYSNCSSPLNRSEAYGFTYDTEAFELDDTSQQLREGGLLTANYLDALDSAVAKTVGESGSYSSDDGSNSSSVRFIMDSLRCIDKTELDYILPLSPGPSHAIPDLEQELALSSDAWSEKMPPSSPSSAYADLALNSPGNGGLKFVSSFDPVISKQEAEELSKAAVKAIKKKCSTDVILHAAKRVACQRAEDLCRKDPDGDTFFMIVVCKPSDSPNFYENLFVMQQHLQKLRVCCDQPIDGGSTDSCKLCRAGPDDWRTPLSETNNAGDSVLSCAVKMGHPEEVINFLCAGVAGCIEDMRRVFDDTGRNFLAVYTNMYPVLKRFL